MSISALTAAQQQLLAGMIRTYTEDQFKAGNFLVYNQVRTAAAPQIQAALMPYLNARLAAAQAQVTALPAQQAAQTAAAAQAVTDVQAVIAQLS